MNILVRLGFGPCILDYPYVYELDGNKLHCNKVDMITGPCNGIIDYDDGFNNLVCKKCGKKYLAIELQESIANKNILIINDEGDSDMSVRLMRGKDIVAIFDPSKETEVIRRGNRRYGNKKEKEEVINVRIVGLPQNPTIQEHIENKQPMFETKTQSLNLSDPIKNNIPEDKEPEQEVAYDPVAIKAAIENNSIKTESKFIPKEEPKVEETPTEKVEEKQSCFGRYIFEDMQCMQCKDSSSCSIERREKEKVHRENMKNNKKNVTDEY